MDCGLKINKLDTITDNVIEAAASILLIGYQRHEALTELRHTAPNSTVVEVPTDTG